MWKYSGMCLSLLCFTILSEQKNPCWIEENETRHESRSTCEKEGHGEASSYENTV
jgi:hypothetical protein